MTITRIISGGQTGADMGGLLAARGLNIATGGWAAKGWMTEEGSREELLRGFGLVECEKAGYPARTRRNIQDANATIIFGSTQSPGSRLTVNVCQTLGIPWVVVTMLGLQEPGKLPAILTHPNIHVLNVAGNRESKAPGIQEMVRKWLVEALG